MLVNLVENRSFTTAVEAVRVTHFPASVRIAQRRLKQSGLRNHIAAKKMLLTPWHREAKVGFALEPETKLFGTESSFQMKKFSSRLATIL